MFVLGDLVQNVFGVSKLPDHGIFRLHFFVGANDFQNFSALKMIEGYVFFF